ncbi:hypothetical protein A0X34_01955 [Campylobacter coli]|nr:hypothetical protein [Campylobacter coli]EAJ7403037.1 hypothetical protein [Campylobacter coli]EED2625721.1 hypothetical protein [Campylobacter coli]EGK8154369.1 hypothetical protein [Campylobacter coli]HEA7231821.1 hypothetical protein [Campylobacter coli]
MNAIYYNDFVVSKIFNYFKNEEPIVFYLSDHGDEVCDFRDFFWSY